MTIHPVKLLVPAAAVWAAVFSLSVAAAAGVGESEGPGAAEAPADTPDAAGVQGEVSDKTLKQFAEAAAEVQKIQQEYAAKAQSLQQNTQQQIISSVQDAGMTVEQFTALVERVQTDPELAERLDSVQVQSQGQ